MGSIFLLAGECHNRAEVFIRNHYKYVLYLKNFQLTVQLIVQNQIGVKTILSPQFLMGYALPLRAIRINCCPVRQ